MNHDVKGANTTTELCPPNPNEFDMAAIKHITQHINELRFIASNKIK